MVLVYSSQLCSPGPPCSGSLGTALNYKGYPLVDKRKKLAIKEQI